MFFKKITSNSVWKTSHVYYKCLFVFQKEGGQHFMTIQCWLFQITLHQLCAFRYVSLTLWSRFWQKVKEVISFLFGEVSEFYPSDIDTSQVDQSYQSQNEKKNENAKKTPYQKERTSALTGPGKKWKK